MQLLPAFPSLTDAMVEISTKEVKTLIERVKNRPGTEVSGEVMVEVVDLSLRAEAGREGLQSGRGTQGCAEVLDPIHRLDATLRSLSHATAAHWFSIIVEEFIGTGHVGHQFEYRGIRYLFHDYRPRKIFLVTGETAVRAAYYRPEGGGKGFFPLDLLLGVDESGTTREAAFMLTHFACETDYPQAEELLFRATGLRLDQNRLHRKINDLGEAAQALQGAPPEGAEPAPAAKCLVIETDGLMVPMRFDPVGADPEKAKAGYHEAHIGLVSIPEDAAPREPQYRRKDRSPDRKAITKADGNPDVKVSEQTYIATYEGRDRHVDKLKVEALYRGWTPETKTIVLGDGADWVREKTAPLFPGAIQILDWHHATEHLGTARDLAYGVGAGKKWYERQEANLWDGKVEPVFRSISYLAKKAKGKAAEKLRTEADFFWRHAWMMDYPAYREKGLPIGSGAVESAARHVVQERCKCSGMRWSPAGLRNVLAVRTTILNGRFDELWAVWASRQAAPKDAAA